MFESLCSPSESCAARSVLVQLVQMACWCVCVFVFVIATHVMMGMVHVICNKGQWS